MCASYTKIQYTLIDPKKIFVDYRMLSAVKGALVLCDPSIKALILKIDSERHDIIIEELDETHLVIDQNKIDYVKLELNRLLSKNIYDPFDDQ